MFKMTPKICIDANSHFKEGSLRLTEHANKDFEPVIGPVIRSGFPSASGFDIVFADL